MEGATRLSIRQITNELIKALQIDTAFKGCEIDPYPIRIRFGESVRKALVERSDEELGIIAGAGLGMMSKDGPFTLYQVHRGTWLHPGDSGRVLLIKIASTAVIADIATVIKLADPKYSQMPKIVTEPVVTTDAAA